MPDDIDDQPEGERAAPRGISGQPLDYRFATKRFAKGSLAAAQDRRRDKLLAELHPDLDEAVGQ